MEIDVDTGEAEVRRFYALDDCGTRINPMIIEGQVHGGLTEALAIAMGQEIAYDEMGNVTTGTLSDFFLPTAWETPVWETDFTVTPSPHHPIGAKGVGESPNVGGVSAFSNAVNDAFRAFGLTNTHDAARPLAHLADRQPARAARLSPMDWRALQERLAGVGYVAGEPLAMALHLSLALGRPLLLEGEAGVGKTELARALADVEGARLIRLQCYEGLDAAAAIYEWNYQRQLLAIRAAGDAADGDEVEERLFSERYLLRRPLLEAILQPEPPVLLIDEVDRADEEFEAYLLEVLADFQITVPELGTLTAVTRPHVVLTSNGTRELSDALRRRCLYSWIEYPDRATELAIVARRAPGRRAAARRADRRLRPGAAPRGSGEGPRHRRDPRLARRALRPRPQRPRRRPRRRSGEPRLPLEDPRRPGRRHARGHRAADRQGRLMPATRFPARAAGPAERVAGFLAHLRLNGLAAGPAETADAVAALARIGAADHNEVRLALKALATGRPSDWRRFDDLFDAYWLNAGRTRAAPPAACAHRRAPARLGRPPRREPLDGCRRRRRPGRARTGTPRRQPAGVPRTAATCATSPTRPSAARPSASPSGWPAPSATAAPAAAGPRAAARRSTSAAPSAASRPAAASPSTSCAAAAASRRCASSRSSTSPAPWRSTPASSSPSSRASSAPTPGRAPSSSTPASSR